MIATAKGKEVCHVERPTFDLRKITEFIGKKEGNSYAYFVR